jgi:hypothetical protein
MVRKPSEEIIKFELIFSENDKEIVEMTMQEYLNLEFSAQSNNMTVEEYFNHILKEIVEKMEKELNTLS